MAESDDHVINPEQNQGGDKLVDLTQNWPTARTVTGKSSDLVTPPSEPEVKQEPDGSYYVLGENDEHIPTDNQGVPAPRTDPATGEPLDPEEPGDTAVKVNVGSLYDAENAMLKLTSAAIDDFESFKNARLENETWVFYAKNKESTEDRTYTRNPEAGEEFFVAFETTGPEVEDPNPERTAELIQNQNALLQAIGGAIHRVGRFAGMYNDAAQIYAAADRSSWID
ncbi:hypothetical protein AB0B85_14270 [Micromonospora sp. NPDC049044]|uniref:hypothetical protein n=1 Tax=Micromonospora sp. NPDC049044 TaxID=3154827 RepID=UPI0033C00E68